MNNKNEKSSFYLSLKETRESKGIDLQSISEATKINIKYLDAIEKGDLNIVPSTFLRLFIKSYAKYIGIDSNEILREYENEKNISSNNIFTSLTSNLSQKEKAKNSIKKELKLEPDNPFNAKNNNTNNDLKSDKDADALKNKLIFKDTKKKQRNLKFNLKENYFLKPQKMFSIFLTISSIVSIYLLISFLNKNQKEKIINTTSNQSINKQDSIDYNKIVDDVLLSSLNFNETNLIDEKSYRLKFNINIPYIFKIVTNKKTKIYVSYDDNNGVRKEECNIIAKRDSLLKFKKYNNIYFDLWSAKDVQIDIDNNSISRYLGKEDVSVRGSFEPKDKLLYLKFYSR